jgi:CreA protein
LRQTHGERFCDEERRVPVYLAWGETIVGGSPENAISTVPLMPWDGQEPVLPIKVDD